MRLLNITTQRLETFYGNDIPRYAILSHMWSREEDEVLFQHIAGSDSDRRKGKKRKGYAKLLAACEQAKRDGWQYIWIDTCCIDKQSSAELSEAINSMYAWYQGSEVCYAYLEDVQSDRKDTRRDKKHKKHGKDSNTIFKTVPFQESRWFTRGWTLQELIAPQRVVFYSSDWVDIGTKASLRDDISSITGIRIEMIINYDPDKASVAERMSWAAKRKTTREEDIAYCLMGFLGVNMPLLYGEGKRAFRRLQEEIMKQSDDHSIFAWRTRYRHYGYTRSEILPDHLELLSETRGMLADTPSDFLGSGNVVRSNNDGPYSAYSMSNRGLQIGLPILQINSKEELITIDSAYIGENIFKVILDCIYRDTTPTRWVVIYLKMVGKDRYIRIFPYWLDGTEINPNEADRDGWVVKPLLVPQVNTSVTSLYGLGYGLKVLPTDSGYCYKGESLVKGGYDGMSMSERENTVDIFIFDREGKSFGVVIGTGRGTSSGTIWIDIITESVFEELSLITGGRTVTSKIESLYKEEGPRYHMKVQRLNLLCVNVSQDHSVDISLAGKLIKHSYELTMDIRRITKRAIPTNGYFLDGLDPRKVHFNFKKEGADWVAIFDSEVKRVLDVGPVHCTRDERHPGIILFSPDGKYLAAGSRSTVQIYDTTTGGTTCVLGDKPILYDCIDGMCFSPDGSRLAIYADEKYIFVWDITKKEILSNFNNQQMLAIQSLRFSPDSQFIISVPTSGMIQSLDVIDGASEDIFDLGDEEFFSVTISPDTRLVARSQDTVIQIWDLENKQLVEELRECDWGMYGMMFTPDGNRLMGVNKNMTLKHWDIGGQTTAGIKQGKEHLNDIWPFVPRNSFRHRYTMNHIAISHDGRWIASMSSIGVQFWDSRDGSLQFTLQSRTKTYRFSYGPVLRPVSWPKLTVGSFGISPVGNIFAVHTSQNTIQIWKYDEIAAMDQS